MFRGYSLSPSCSHSSSPSITVARNHSHNHTRNVLLCAHAMLFNCFPSPTQPQPQLRGTPAISARRPPPRPPRASARVAAPSQPQQRAKIGERPSPNYPPRARGRVCRAPTTRGKSAVNLNSRGAAPGARGSRPVRAQRTRGTPPVGGKPIRGRPTPGATGAFSASAASSSVPMRAHGMPTPPRGSRSSTRKPPQPLQHHTSPGGLPPRPAIPVPKSTTPPPYAGPGAAASAPSRPAKPPPAHLRGAKAAPKKITIKSLVGVRECVLEGGREGWRGRREYERE
jgi:hypothetical protein